MAVGACMGNENKSSTPFVSSLMNDQKYFLYCFNIRKRGWNNNKSYIRLVEPNLDVFQLFHQILIIKLRDCRGKIVFRRTFCSYCEEKKMIFLNVMTKNFAANATSLVLLALDLLWNFFRRNQRCQSGIMFVFSRNFQIKISAFFLFS